MAEQVFESLAIKQLDVGTEQLQAGKTGRPAFFHANTNVRLGGWFNASKSYMDFGSAGTGSVTGMASASNSEIRLPNQNLTSLGGVYTAVEANLIFQASTVMADNINYPCSLASFKVSGDSGAIDAWQDDSAGACVFHFGGLGAADGSVFATGTGGAMAASLRIIIDGVNYYIMLATTPSTA